MHFISSLLFGLFALLGTAYSGDFTPCDEHQCLAVVDAGSTGTRLHIYAYDKSELETPINIKELWSKKINLALGNLYLGQATVNTYLDTLFSDAPSHTLPVYFYATGGMRLHSYVKQQRYYEHLKHWFAEQSQWQLVDAKTITGKEEGKYGWLAINYKLGRLETPSQSFASVMDMGGASVQVVFPVQNDSRMNPTDLVDINLNGRHIYLFSHSFLGLGQTLVSNQFLNTPSCYSRNYQLPNGELGEGNAYACRDSVAKLVNQVHEVNRIVQPVIESNPSSEWYVMGGVLPLIHAEPFRFDELRFTNQALIEQAQSKICQQSWSKLHEEFSHDEYIHAYCLQSSYYHALMVNGYGLHSDGPINYVPRSQDTSWTLGVVVLHQK